MAQPYAAYKLLKGTGADAQSFFKHNPDYSPAKFFFELVEGNYEVSWKERNKDTGLLLDVITDAMRRRGPDVGEVQKLWSWVRSFGAEDYQTYEEAFDAYRELTDLERARNKIGKVGVSEWWEGFRGVEAIPFNVEGMQEAAGVRKAIERLNKGEYFSEEERDLDLARVKIHQKSAELMAGRGMTIWAMTAEGVAQMAPYVAEIGFTGAAVGLGKAAVGGLGKRALIKTAKLAGMSALMPNRVLEKAEQYKMEGDSDLRAFTKGYASNFVSTMIETVGGDYISKLGKVAGLGKLQRGFERAIRNRFFSIRPGSLTDDFANAVLKAGGFHGLLVEMGEEEVDRVAQRALGLDEWRTMTGKEYAAQALTFAIPMAAGGLMRMTPTWKRHERRQEIRRLVGLNAPELSKKDRREVATKVEDTLDGKRKVHEDGESFHRALAAGIHMDQEQYDAVLRPLVDFRAILAEKQLGWDEGEWYRRVSVAEGLGKGENFLAQEASVVGEMYSKLLGVLENDEILPTLRTQHIQGKVLKPEKEITLPDGTTKVLPAKTQRAQVKTQTAQILQRLKDEGVTEEELAFTGVEGLLESRQEISLDELKRFALANQVKVIVDTLGGRLEPEQQKELDSLTAQYQYLENEHTRLYDEAQEAAREIPEYAALAREGESRGGQEEYVRLREAWVEASKRLPEYQEFDKVEGQRNQVMDRIKEIRRVAEATWESLTLPGAKTNYRELIFRFPGAEQFTHDHWPGMINPYMHMRVSDRIGANGEKILHIEEVQSDWFQRGAKEGFKGHYSSWEEMEADGWRATEDHPGLWFLEHAERDIKISPRGGLAWSSREAVEAEAVKYFDKRSPPLAPFSTTWKRQAARYALMQAALGDYDAISWNTGVRQAAIEGVLGNAEIAQGMIEGYDVVFTNAIKHEGKRHAKRDKVEKVEFEDEIEAAGDLANTVPEGMSEGKKKLSYAPGSPGILLDPEARQNIIDHGISLFQRSEVLEAWKGRSDLAKSSVQELRTLFGTTSLMKGAFFIDQDGALIPIKGTHLDALRSTELGKRLIVESSMGGEYSESKVMSQFLRETGLVRGGWNTQTSVAFAQMERELSPDQMNSMMELPRHLQVVMEFQGRGMVKAEGQSIGPFLRAEGLGQEDKAGITILPGRQYILHFTEKSDASSAIHELFHIWRTQLNPKQLAALEKALGVKEGKWTKGQEEQAARAFERAVFEGKVKASEALQDSFEELADWMKDIYGQVKGTELSSFTLKSTPGVGYKVKFNQKIRDVFDSMFGFEPGEATPVEQLPPSEPQDLSTFLLQTSEETKEAKKEFAKRSAWRDTWDFVRSLIDFTPDLNRTPAGRRLLTTLDNMNVEANTTEGKYELNKMRAYKLLKAKDRAWLNTESRSKLKPSNKYSNERLMIEEDLKPPRICIQLWRDMMLSMMGELGEMAEEARVRRHKRHGKGTELFTKASTGRLMRAFHEDAIWAMTHSQSEEYQVLVEGIKGDNPELKELEIKRELKRMHEGVKIKGVGMLEWQRKFDKVPDAIEYGSGKRLQVLHTEPLFLATKSIENQARRIAFIRHLGQRMMKLPKYKALREVTKALGIRPEYNAEVRKQNLLEAGATEEMLEGLSYKEMGDLSKSWGLARGLTLPQLEKVLAEVETLEPMDERDFKRFKRAVRGYGVPVEGLSPDETLREFRQRLTEADFDLADSLIEQHVREGGKEQNARLVVGLAQGLSYNQSLGRGISPRNPIKRTWKFISGLIGTAHVGMAAIPNLLQPFTLNLVYTGPVRTTKALVSMLTNWKQTELLGLTAGAYHRLDVPKGYEKGHTLENINRAVRDLSTRLTLLKLNLHKNNVWAGESFRLLANDWKRGKFSVSDSHTARDIGLSEEDIGELQKIKAGKAKMSDHLYRKIIQRGVASTQFITEDSYRQGLLTVSPVMRDLFPYQSYTSGTLRGTAKIINDVGSSIKKGDIPKSLTAIKRLFTMLSAFAGIGWATNVLRSAIQRRPPDDDEKTVMDNLAEGLVATQLLGPVTRTLFHSSRTDTDMDKLMIGFMPKIKAVGDAMSIAINLWRDAETPKMGRYGKLPFSNQLVSFTKRHSSVARTALRWAEHTAYPQLQPYLDARRLSRQFKTKRDEALGKPPTAPPSSQLNPKFLEVSRAMTRGDFGEAERATMRYYETHGKEDVWGATKALRSHLRNKRPINLAEKDFYSFFMTVPLSQREDLWNLDLNYMLWMDYLAPTKG